MFMKHYAPKRCEPSMGVQWGCFFFFGGGGGGGGVRVDVNVNEGLKLL